jgi:hypothetical protein
MAKDEFEVLLDRCRENLSEINLRIPTLETGTPRPPVYSLTSAPSPKVAAPPPPLPPPKLSVPPKTPEPPPPAASRHEAAPVLPTPAPAAAAPAPALTPEPAPPREPQPRVGEEREEDEVFPPARIRERTPPASVPLWRSQSVPEPTPMPVPATSSTPASALRATAAAAVVAVGAFGVWLARRPAPDLDIKVDAADAMTLRPKGDLLVAEGKELVDLAQDGRTLERRPLDAPVESLLWEQSSLWSTDGRTASILEHSDDGRTTSFRLNHVPAALYVKDNYLWTVEKGARVLHQFLISRSILGAILQPLDSFELNALSPETFTFDDAGTLWLVDEPTRRLYRLRLENGSYKRSSSAPLSPIVGPQGSLRSLTIEDGAVWILAQTGNGHASLRRIAISRFDWTP